MENYQHSVQLRSQQNAHVSQEELYEYKEAFYLDYLYKHCLFAVIRVRDNKDFDFLDGVIDVLSNLTEGWERVGLSIKKAPAFAW